MAYKAAVILGSDSDLPVAKKAFEVFEKFGVEYSARIMSAHRTPGRVAEFASAAAGEGYGVIIAFAGKAAHLAGVIAANTALPVIGVPIKGSDLGGLDALLSTVQMPSGVPVACVAIDGGANAAYLALRMLALTDAGLAQKLRAHRDEMEQAVIEKDIKLCLGLE